jgi:hypothetical protein
MVIYCMVIYGFVLFVQSFYTLIFARRTLQMHVYEQRSVMIPVLRHKIGELMKYLPTHSLICSLSAAGG